MAGVVSRYGFAAVVGLVLALGTGAAVWKGMADGKGGPKGAAPVASSPGKAGPAAAKGPGAGRGETPLVQARPIKVEAFSDAIQALGTAQARESVTITAKVTDVISAIRFESGDQVRRGQVLVELSSVEQRADLAEADAQLVVNQREFDRFKELFDRGFAARARLDEAQAALERSQARVAALKARIADRTIRAPFAGVMGLRTASPGALARPGEAIATLDDISVIKLDFTVPQPQLSRMTRGAAIVARSDAHPGRDFTGQIDDVDSRIDPTTRSVRVRALLGNADGAIKPGMLMTVIVRSNPREALALPEMAVLERIDGSSVFKVVDKDGKPTVVPVQVQTGQRAEGLIEIVSGLNPGERVVVEGVQRVRPGQTVRLAEPKGETVAPAAAKPASPPA